MMLETKPIDVVVAVSEPENSLNNERKRRERLASKLQMAKQQQQIQANGPLPTAQLTNSHKVNFIKFFF